jgi:toxin ParE1/3/4
MTGKPIRPRARAHQDIAEAIDYHFAEGGAPTARGFIDAVEQAFAHIALYPASGSPHYGHELNLRGLRSWRLERHPYLIFYLDQDDHIDVWRVLHGRRDIPASLQERGDVARDD